jgi:hypothetical protein
MSRLVGPIARNNVSYTSLDRLNDLALASVQGKLDESVSCVMNEALIEHKIILGLDSFTTFPATPSSVEADVMEICDAYIIYKRASK